MENQSLKKRLYQNLNQKPPQHSFLLQKDTNNQTNALKPKINQETASDNRNSPKQLLPGVKNLLKSKQNFEKKKLKPKEVQIDKLSKEAKIILDETKFKSKNLRPHQIFAFYDAFPEMIEDFFYLNRMSHPYDYQIVSYAKRNQNQYMTISSQGVTLYHEKQAEFLTKEEWLADEKIYQKLQKIDFFSQYKISKNFTIWKNKMKRHYMKSISNILSQKLFLIYLYPRDCLKDIQQLCLALEESFLPIQINENRWDQLLTKSESYLNSTTLKRFKEIESQIIEKLEYAIGEQIRNFKENNKIKIEGLENRDNKNDKKEGYIYSQQAILRKQYKRVLKLIKMADGMFLESKIQMFKNWLAQIIEKLKEDECSPNEDWITIVFQALPPSLPETQKQIEWSPSKQNFIQTFRMILNKSVDLIAAKHQKLLSHPAFEKYQNTDNQSLVKQDEENNLKNLIEKSDFYQENLKEVETCMENYYGDVVIEQENLRKFVEIYHSHKSMPSTHVIIKQSSIAELGEFVRDWQMENEQMKKLEDKKSRMIKFDFSLLRKQMSKVPQQSLADLLNLLPGHLSNLCHTTQKQTKNLLASIDILPNDANFLEFTKAVKNSSDELEEINGKGTQIKQLLILLAENKKTNIDIHKTNQVNVMNAINKLRNKVDEANAMYDQRLSKFKKDIEATIEKTKSSFKEITTKFEQVQLEQNETQIQMTVYKIGSILPQICEIQKQAKRITNIEIQLGLDRTNFQEPHQLYAKIQNLHELWLCKKQWKQFIIGLYSIHYKNVDCSILTSNWLIFNERFLKIKETSEETEYIIALGENLKEFQNLIGLVQAFQSKNLDQKSWKQICEYLTYEMDKKESDIPETQYPFYNPGDEKYTIQWLIENGVCFFKEKIEFIVKKSEKQSEIKGVHIILRNYISNLSLEFVNKKRELVLLSENQQVFQELNDHLASLLQIFNHEYSENIKKQTKALAKYYEYVIEILENLRIFGENWEKYEEFFDPQRHLSKQLSKESKDFSSWETQWKKLIKAIAFESNWSKKMEDQIKGINPSKTMLKGISKANAPLEQIKRGVEQFLDKRRLVFPHYFYFSDSELLSILKKTDDMLTFNKQVFPLIYDHLSHIKLQKDNDLLISITSKDEEELKINKVVTSKIIPEIQEVLKVCEETWKKSLISTIKKVFSEFISHDVQVPRRTIIKENVTQVLLAFDHIVWVKLAEQTYLVSEPIGSLEDWIKIQNQQINDGYQFLMGEPVNQRKKIEQYIMQAIYLREKTEGFRKININSLSSYEWQRTPKLCDGTGNMHEKLFLRILGSSVNYGGEFIGCSGNYYISPESQRSYIHLSQSIQERKVSLLTNPSSHQTLKQFSNLVAQPFKTFILNESIEEKMIERILAGTLSQGLWCFIKTSQKQLQLLALIARHISNILKCINDGSSAQINKYNIILNQNVIPAFFLSCLDMGHFQTYNKGLNHEQYRPINLVRPNTRNMLGVITESVERDATIGEKVYDYVENIKKMFGDDKYIQINEKFYFKILSDLRRKGIPAPHRLDKEIYSTITNSLDKVLLADDKILLENFIESNTNCNDQKLKTKKVITSRQLVQSGSSFYQLFDSTNCSEYSEKTISNIERLYSMIQNTEPSKKIVVLGSALSGKSYTIEITRQMMSKKFGVCIETKKIYHKGYAKETVVSNSEKKKGIIQELISCSSEGQKWIILDGHFDSYYKTLGADFLTKRNEQRKEIKFFLETDSLQHVGPDVVQDYSILYLEEQTNSYSQLVRNIITKPLYTIYEQKSRENIKNQEKIHIKYLSKNCKSIGLLHENIEYLVNHLNSLLLRVTSKGSIKMKSIECLYNIQGCQLAYKCAKMIQGIFKMNWETIKEKQKNGSKKILEKFGLWVLIWTLQSLIKPEDTQKFQKYISETFKISSTDQYLKGAVYPGSGLEIHSIKSQRAQSSLPHIPGRGVPTNLLTYNASVFELNQNKHKFYEEIYLDQPLYVRVNTSESIKFSYLSNIAQYSESYMLIAGPPGSGKRSIIDIHNKNCHDKIDSYVIRPKKHNPYLIQKQVQQPFAQNLGIDKQWLKPVDISKKVHICVEDLHLTPKQLCPSQFLRMAINENGIYNEQGKWKSFRQAIFSMILSQYQQHNLAQIKFNRLLTKVNIFRTSQNSKEKISSIFCPIIETWGSSVWPEDSPYSQVFTNRNGENIVNSIIGIYSLMKEYTNSLKCTNSQERNLKMLLSPKLQDICFIFSGICQSQGLPNNINISKYYSDFWGHEVIRVFGDRVNEVNLKKSLIDEIKKESLLKFKENFILPESQFIFTNFHNTQDNFISQCNDIEEIYRFIQNIHEEQTIKYPLPIWFDELIEEIIKLYRVISQNGGHLLVLTPYSNGNRALLKLTCYLKDYLFHELSDTINPDSYVLPVVLNEINTCFYVDPLAMTDEFKYQIDCVVNNTMYIHEFSHDNRQKIRSKLFKIAEQKVKDSSEQLHGTNNNMKGRGTEMQNSESLMKVSMIQSKISHNLDGIICEQFRQRSHFVMPIKITDPETSSFLYTNSSILKNMQVISFQFKEQTILSVGQSLLEQISEQKQNKKKYGKLLEQCKQVLGGLPDNQNSYQDFLKLLKNSATLMESADDRLEKQEEYERKCIIKRANYQKQLENAKQQLVSFHQEIEMVMKQIESINKQYEGEDKTEDEKGEYQSKSRELKHKKQNVEQKHREAIILINNMTELLEFYPSDSIINQKIQEIKQTRTSCEKNCIIVAASLLFLNNSNQQQYLEVINRWRAILNEKPISHCGEMLSIFEIFLEKYDVRVPGWECFDEFTQLKGIHFFENLKGIIKSNPADNDDYFLDSAFTGSVLVVKDEPKILVDLLRAKVEGQGDQRSNSDQQLQLLDCFPQKKSGKMSITNKNKQKESKNFKNEALSFAQKLIQKYRNGLIILGSDNPKEQLKRSDIEFFQRILRMKKVNLNNRIILYGSKHPNITFYVDSKLPYANLEKLSIKIEFGENSAAQKRKMQIGMTKFDYAITEKKQQMLQISASNDEVETTLQQLKKIEQQIKRYQDYQRKNNQKLKQDRFNPSDRFLILWICQLIGDLIVDSDNISEIYEFIKKSYLQLKITTQEDFKSLQEIPPETYKSWQNILNVNLFITSQPSLRDMITYSMPICNKSHLIIIKNQKGVLKALSNFANDDLYSLNFINLHDSGQTLCQDLNQSEIYKKKLNIYQNYVATNKGSQNMLYEHIDRNKQNSYHVSIVVCDKPKRIKEDENLSNEFQIRECNLEVKQASVIEQLETIIQNFESIDFIEAIKDHKQSNQETGLYEGSNRIDKQAQRNIIKSLEQAILLYMKYLDNKKSSNLLKHSICLDFIKNVGYLDRTDKSQRFLEDLVMQDNCEFTSTLKQIYEKCLESKISYQLEEIIHSVKEKEEKQPKQSIVSNNIAQQPNNFLAVKVEIIEQMIQSLPFSFNLYEVREVIDPLEVYIITLAKKFNVERSNLKKYLQEILKFTQVASDKHYGSQVLDSSMVLSLLIQKMNFQYAAIKKSLEQLGLISGEGINTYKVIGNASQNHTLAAIAGCGYNTKGLNNISSKFIIMMLLRACRKMKIPFNRMKCMWKIYSGNTIIQQPITNPELSVLFNMQFNNSADLFQIPFNPSLRETEEKQKIIMIPYDPEAMLAIMNQTLKQGIKGKKEKAKKNKQELKKQVNIIQSEQKLFNVNIVSSNEKNVGYCRLGLCKSTKNQSKDDTQKWLEMMIKGAQIRLC